MADGKWQMANGRWQMADGRWQMADGRWQSENRESPFVPQSRNYGGTGREPGTTPRLDALAKCPDRSRVSRRASQPCALTIAGSDSGGGAGAQMDLKVFASLGVHGTSAITCLTAQNPDRVSGVQAARPEMVAAQIEAVFDGFSPKAVKTGMLYSAPIIRVVAGALSALPGRPALVVDPVMIATSGAALLKPSARRALETGLIPLAALVTPNLDEAEALLGRSISDVDGLREAAREIRKRFGCAALVKGGHLQGSKVAVDAYCDGRNELALETPFERGVSTHGTGCSYSAAIAGHLALGSGLKRAVQEAKRHVTESIRQSVKSGGQFVLNSFWSG